MVTITLKCVYCDSQNLVRNGHAPNGKQKYLCQDCRKSCRENPSSPAYTEAEREMILRAYEERSSLRGLTRTFGVARNTVSEWLKKKTLPYQS
jgi:transposase-like protein